MTHAGGQIFSRDRCKVKRFKTCGVARTVTTCEQRSSTSRVDGKTSTGSQLETVKETTQRGFIRWRNRPKMGRNLKVVGGGCGQMWPGHCEEGFADLSVCCALDQLSMLQLSAPNSSKLLSLDSGAQVERLKFL